ncbi:Transglutaminase [Lutibaculum baratangense AMV1]|uniref:Transglutaminase n=1 Tax=Lutibaculum baratangense AMV1 TaxID=631454 RepID=V4RMZ2_9HYPH|nr:Transglutaminase [Lutibaculum baratangense AMV1]
MTHRTTYRYARPVAFGDHRMMSRPRDSHDLRLRETWLTVSPAAETKWMHDVFGNSVAHLHFTEPGDTLEIVSEFLAEHYSIARDAIELDRHAETYPFSYSADEVVDLGRTRERHYDDPDHVVDEWARSFIDVTPDRQTLPMLEAMCMAVKRDFGYARREDEGTQDPGETLRTKAGSCRDFALLMMEACRSLGLAAQFVTGYLYDDALVGGGEGLVGGGETHAWLQVFLPGAGWVEFDPTNGIIGGRNLIRVGIARDPSQASPLSGSYEGAAEDFLGMDVEVTVAAEGPDDQRDAA